MKGKEGIRIERKKFIAGIFIGVFMSLLGYGQDQPQPGPAPGTGKIVVEADPDVHNSFIVRLPEGIALVGEEGGQARMIAGPVDASITCTCTDGKGDCSPVYLPGLGLYCAIGKRCQVCERSATTQSTNRQVVLDNPILINLRKGVKIVQRIEDIPREPINSTMLELDTVINSIMRLYKPMMWLSDSFSSLAQWMAHDTLTFGYVVIDVFGRWAVIPYALEFIDHPYVALRMEGGKCICECGSKGGGGCTGKCSKKLGALFCVAGNCQSCTMKLNQVVQVDPTNRAVQIQIKQFIKIAPNQYRMSVELTSPVPGHAVFRVLDLVTTSWGLQEAYREDIVFKKNVPVEKTFTIQVSPDNSWFVILQVSDGVGRIFGTKSVGLPK